MRKGFMRHDTGGFTLVEMIIALTVLSIVTLSIMRIQAFMSVQSININSRAFATQKAIQMMEELRSIVETQNINVLDNYNDGSKYQYILTTQPGLADPGNRMSGNVVISGHWKYARQVAIIPMPNDSFSRQVFVRVYRNTSTDPNTPVPAETLAETSAILKTIVSNYVPSQYMDVYIIALENVPGWWSSLSTMRPMFLDVIQDMQMRNPGLIINSHWITRSAYGRDQRYTPYTNSTLHTNDAPGMPYVYFYPGLTDDDNGNDLTYYDNTIIGGQVNVDGVVQNTCGYVLADMYNHAVRYPQEVSLYNAAVTAAAAAGQPTPQPSLRMLLEDMNTNPAKYKNALLINLHGELLPLPPMRNYSDAAKTPGDCPYVRLVTHPENLQYPAGGRVKLRVYPYLSKPNAAFYNDNGSGGHLAGSPVLKRYDSAVFFDWAALAPATGVATDNFSVRWTGLIFPRFSETYTFTATTDDGVRLYINNALQTVATGPGWTDHTVAPTTWNVNLTGGTTYSLKLEYYDHGGQAVAKLSWSSPTQTLETVPITVLPAATVKVNTFLNVNNGNYFDGNLTNGEITVNFISGNNIGTNYASTALTRLGSGVTPTYGVPSWSISNPDTASTLFTFYYTPLVAPSTGTTALTTGVSPFTTLTNSLTSGGQATNYYLYDMEYTPCPVKADFSQDLTSAVNGPKNTARWIIDFASNTIPTGTLSVETRLGSGISTPASCPENLSTTYAWVGVTAPITEQYQFMGDPRHCPYQDVKAANGYNWYFTQVPAAYSGFSQTAAGWGTYNCDIDVPRFYQIYRSGLLNTSSLWTAMNGCIYFYYGLGGEFGANQYPSAKSLPFIKTPWSTTGETTVAYYDEILPVAGWHSGTCVSNANVVALTDNSWYAKYWLGELYDDSDFPSWKTNGNQPVGVGNYYRANYTTFPAFGYTRAPCPGYNGASSFFNGKSSAGTGPFLHVSEGNIDSSGNYTGDFATITTYAGLPMSTAFNYPLPGSIADARPFELDGGSGNNPDEWNNTVYSSQRTTLAIPTKPSPSQTYYTSTTGMIPSAVVKISSGTQTCYVVVSGLTPQADFGAPAMGRLNLIGMMNAFMEAGLYQPPPSVGQDHISQIPRVEIITPKVSAGYIASSASHIVNITWSTAWKRWDNTKYTADYDNTYDETATTPLVYAVKYSADGGRTWKYCVDGSSTTLGDKDLTRTVTASPYGWDISAMAGGAYYIRVECFRRDIGLHYACDTVEIDVSN